MRYIAAMAALLLLMGCSPNPSKPSTEHAQRIVDKITYAKDQRTELCFAVVTVDQSHPYSTGGVSITHVPCDKVDSQLK